MPYANLQGDVTDILKQDIINRIESIKTDLNFLINLTKKERQSGRLGQDNKIFMASAIEGARSNLNLIPPSFSMLDWEKDYALYQNLLPIKQQVAILFEALDDTCLAARMECQKASFTFLKLAKTMIKSNVPGIDTLVNDLELKANSRGKKKKVASN